MATENVCRKKRKLLENQDEEGHRTDHIENSPILQIFQCFQKELDDRYDKYERVVKLGRDITIQSKKIIFLLHRGLDEKKRTEILEEAGKKLGNIKDLFRKVASEVLNEDHYQFLRAYSPGLQEFIEAYSFWYFLKHGTLVSLEEMSAELAFEKTPKGGEKEHKNYKELKVLIPMSEYLLGISDLTGELMRMAINSVSKGNLAMPVTICETLRSIYNALLELGPRQKGLPKKLDTLKESLKKVENTCYMIHIQSSEVSENMLATLVASSMETQENQAST